MLVVAYCGFILMEARLEMAKKGLVQALVYISAQMIQGTIIHFVHTTEEIH